jgi:hydroxyacylglutathione hydrolase
MKILEDLYVYPWLSYTENNANAVYIDGPLPVLIDPGHTHLVNHVVEGMARDGKSIDDVGMIICTHGHPDHIESLDSFDDEVVRAIGRVEYEHLYNGGKELYLMTGCRPPTRPFKVLLREGELKLDGKTFRIIPTPGHSPGSLCLYWEEEKVLISGDTVFYMGVGRTDLPGGDLATLGRSLERLMTLDIEYLIPGHGEMLKGRASIEKNFRVLLDEFF